jgi:pantoate kinase
VVNYAYYGIPIKGDDNLLKHKLENLLKVSNKFAIVKGFLFIEEYYFEKIEDNEVAIQAVKEAMLKDVAFIEQYVQQVNVEVESFKSTLTNKINTEIAMELDKRRIKQETIDKLNPFD